MAPEKPTGKRQLDLFDYGRIAEPGGFEAYAASCAKLLIHSPKYLATFCRGWQTEYEQALAKTNTTCKPTDILTFFRQVKTNVANFTDWEKDLHHAKFSEEAIESVLEPLLLPDDVATKDDLTRAQSDLAGAIMSGWVEKRFINKEAKPIIAATAVQMLNNTDIGQVRTKVEKIQTSDWKGSIHNLTKMLDAASKKVAESPSMLQKWFYLVTGNYPAIIQPGTPDEPAGSLAWRARYLAMRSTRDDTPLREATEINIGLDVAQQMFNLSSVYEEATRCYNLMLLQAAGVIQMMQLRNYNILNFTSFLENSGLDGSYPAMIDIYLQYAQQQNIEAAARMFPAGLDIKTALERLKNANLSPELAQEFLLTDFEKLVLINKMIEEDPGRGGGMSKTVYSESNELLWPYSVIHRKTPLKARLVDIISYEHKLRSLSTTVELMVRKKGEGYYPLPFAVPVPISGDGAKYLLLNGYAILKQNNDGSDQENLAQFIKLIQEPENTRQILAQHQLSQPTVIDAIWVELGQDLRLIIVPNPDLAPQSMTQTYLELHLPQRLTKDSLRLLQANQELKRNLSKMPITHDLLGRGVRLSLKDHKQLPNTVNDVVLKPVSGSPPGIVFSINFVADQRFPGISDEPIRGMYLDTPYGIRVVYDKQNSHIGAGQMWIFENLILNLVTSQVYQDIPEEQIDPPVIFAKGTHPTYEIGGHLMVLRHDPLTQRQHHHTPEAAKYYIEAQLAKWGRVKMSLETAVRIYLAQYEQKYGKPPPGNDATYNRGVEGDNALDYPLQVATPERILSFTD